MDNQWSAARAWREHFDLTQADVAGRMGIAQGACAQLEGKLKVWKSSREKIAAALRLYSDQLDF